MSKSSLKTGMDGVFLPRKIHGCDYQAYIIYFNPDANEGDGCVEIEIVDKERILKCYNEVNGDSKKFFGHLPDLFNGGEWYYCYTDSEEFQSYVDEYPKADFICGRDGDETDEMMFLVNWARGA